jgi:hypothetical protein
MGATLEFLLQECMRVDSLFQRPRFADHSRETVAAVLDSCERFARENLAPINPARCRGTAVRRLYGRFARLRARCVPGVCGIREVRGGRYRPGGGLEAHKSWRPCGPHGCRRQPRLTIAA